MSKRRNLGTQPPKAYKNLDFLNSPAARHIRILCEYEEPRQRLKAEDVHDTIVFFGSARSMGSEEAAARVAKAEAAVAASPDDAAAAYELSRANVATKLAPFYDQARELARRLTEWNLQKTGGRHYVITTGGGPGMMEAGNRGAADVPGGKSIGLGISLPFEQGVNRWVTPELAFEFHYFFTRKYWFLYPCKALVGLPGGFGTLDELFETLTLVQTGKIKKRMPVVLLGKAFWNDILDLEAMARWGTISEKDLDLVFLTDSVDEAFEYLVRELSEQDANATPRRNA